MRDTAGPPLRILTLTTLYPNAAMPAHGVFVETRLRHLVGTGHIEAQVVAPVPWVPPPLRQHPRYRDMAAAPPAEKRNGLPVSHPRYVVLPKIGMSLTPYALERAFLAGIAEQKVDMRRIDLIDAHYFYPDGVAAARVARRFNKRLVISGRGTDLNLVPRHALPRRMIRWAAGRADALITVCAALKEPLVSLGIPEERVSVLRNGVDLQRFRPHDPAACRRALGVEGTVLLSVGLLVERKGHHLIIEALPKLPGVTLLIAGDGEQRDSLPALARRLGVADRVSFLGAVANDRLAPLYSAADALVLASSREGWANVLLEAMACGTPVIASRVWGTPEVVTDPAAGVLIEQRSADGIVEAVHRQLATAPDRTATRAFAERFSWDATVAAQVELYRKVARRTAVRS